MVANKDRVYVTLYARSEPGTYHWALTRSPKEEDTDDLFETTRYHVRNLPSADGDYWEYDHRETRSMATSHTLVRILISKIESRKVERMERVLRDVELKQNDRLWDCKSWVQQAVEELGKVGLIRGWNWSDIEEKALWYVAKKTEEGRFETPEDGEEYDNRVHTYDMPLGRETQA
jgi:hypothetical protein